MRSDLTHRGRGKAARVSLRRGKKFANLGHADGAIAEQKVGDGALRRIVREPKWIAGGYPVIDYQA